MIMANEVADNDILSTAVHFPWSDKTARNRFWKSAMTERLCTFSETDELGRGRPTEEYRRLYSVFAAGGSGVIVTGNIMVQRRFLEAKGNAIIDQDLQNDDVLAFQGVADIVKRQGSLILGQLCHPGYQATSTLSHRICVSPVQGDTATPPPLPLTVEDIDEIRLSFARAAKVLHAAGFDGVQLHAAYGHLLTQFLSAASNSRTDRYGGSFENRCTLLLETIEEIRKTVNDASFIISVKLSSLDFIRPDAGFSYSDASLLASRLEELHVDVIELSGAAYEFPSSLQPTEMNKQKHAHFEQFLECISRPLNRTLIAINGGLRTRGKMAEIVNSGSVSFVGLARTLCAEPDIPSRFLDGSAESAKDNKISSAGLQFLGAIYQLRAIGDGKDIPDFSDEKVAEAFVATAKW